MNKNKSTTQLEYRITNWKDYNQSLAARGSLTLWVDVEVLSSWQAAAQPGKNGRPFCYSDSCIQLLAVLHVAYHLPLRQTIGFARSIFRLMGCSPALPDYTTLCRRLRKVAIPLGLSNQTGPLVLAVDSTGVKVSGEGEWKTRLHGKTKTRVWRKLHIGLDCDSREIVAVTVTDAPASDHQQVVPLLEQLQPPLAEFLGDMAYDTRGVRLAVAVRNALATIPPRRNSALWPAADQAATERNAATQYIRVHGRVAWKHMSGYHQRSQVETAMWRYKATFGDRLTTKTDSSQEAELRLRTQILNRFTQLGMPRFAVHTETK